MINKENNGEGLNTCVPVVQWAGGKRQLLSKIKERMPKEYETYYEPFFGGGALFFELLPEEAVINDFNPQLINVYNQIKTDYVPVLQLLDQYQNQYNALETKEAKAAYYYTLRKEFNKRIVAKELSSVSAALFIFLNRTCFNALYRVNSKGEFNVPFGRKTHANTYDLDNIQAVSKCLEKVKILNTDFELACESAKEGDFIFFDSPYYDTFDTYQAGGFSEENHKRLAALYQKLTDKGVFCMLTNSDTDFIKGLYKRFKIEIIDVKRAINSDATKRTGKEILVVNYDKGK